jgi:uncharacterized membrane protein YbaN (DUF454 family)
MVRTIKKCIKIKVMENFEKKLKVKKNLLIVLSILLGIIGIGIVTLSIMGLLPLSLLLTFPFIILIIYKMGKDVDVIVDKLLLLDVMKIFDEMEDEVID